MSDLAIQRWLEKTVRERGDVASALVVLDKNECPARTSHWPTDQPRDEDLWAAVRAGVPAGAASPVADRRIVTRRVRAQGRTVGTLAMRLAAPLAEPQLAPALAPAITGPPVLREVSAPAQESDALLKLMRTALASPQFDHSATALTTELARAFSCDRVFVGMSVRRFVQVKGLSHGASLGHEQALVRMVGAAMDAAVDQGASIAYPQHPDARPRITLAHALLAHRSSGIGVLTVPLFVAGTAVGALTLERPQASPFDAVTVRHIEAITEALAPLLLLKFEHQRSAFQRLRGGLSVKLGRLATRQRRALLMGSLTAIGALVALLGSQWSFQISATTRLEGQVQRAVVAPVDGFLKSAHVRAGDAVREGQLLAELSDEDLRLEHRRWETEVARHEHAFAEAQAKADRTQLVVADARAAESRAQLALVDHQLARTRLLAPFDALVIKGDLTQQLGTPVKRGDVLLTLTPSREFRVMLEIDERDVGHVRPGASGAVTLSALPQHRFPLVIERVMPVAKVDAGRNVFEAEARMTTAADASQLRPGLQGVARLDAGERPLYWLASHRMLDWWRLQWWSWVG